MYADSLGFLAPPGEDPFIDVQERPNVSLVHLTSVPPFIEDFHTALEEHGRFARHVLENRDVVEVRSRQDLPIQAPFTGIVFGMQHAPGDINSKKQVRRLADAGVRFMALAYAGKVSFGSGFLEEGNLTRQGQDLLGWMAECGVTLDLSHASMLTAIDALNFIEREELPMKPLASHSGCRTIFGHKRNLPDYVLQRIGNLDGYVGIPTISFFISSQDHAFRYEFKRHVLCAANCCGFERVGIGSDGVHRDLTIEKAEESYRNLTVALKSPYGTDFGERFPDHPMSLIVNGSRQLPLLWNLLLEEGFSRKEADDVCGDNFIRYLERALPAA